MRSLSVKLMMSDISIVTTNEMCLRDPPEISWTQNLLNTEKEKDNEKVYKEVCCGTACCYDHRGKQLYFTGGYKLPAYERLWVS